MSLQAGLQVFFLIILHGGYRDSIHVMKVSAHGGAFAMKTHWIQESPLSAELSCACKSYCELSFDQSFLIKDSFDAFLFGSVLYVLSPTLKNSKKDKNEIRNTMISRCRLGRFRAARVRSKCN